MHSSIHYLASRVLPLILAGVFCATASVATYADEASRGSETRLVNADVVNVRLEGSIDLKVRQSATPAMTVHAEKDQLPRIITQQEGNTLYIRPKGRWFINWLRSLVYQEGPVIVELGLPALQKLAMQGSGNATVTGFGGDQVQLDITGSGDIAFNNQYRKIIANIQGSGNIRFDGVASDEMSLNLTGAGAVIAAGQSRLLTANLTGSCSLDARQLISDSATVNLTGSGNASIFAKSAANVSSVGAGTIHVFGKPLQRKVNSVGVANVDFE